MQLVLITGAGASRELGENEPMPLMADWSNALRDALNASEAYLADAVQRQSRVALVCRWPSRALSGREADRRLANPTTDC